MNCLFSSCTPIVPEPDHPQTFPTWVFQNGTSVNAFSAMSAIKKLEVVQTKHYWAMEIEPDVWDIQFDEDVAVEYIRACDAPGAAQLARFYLEEDCKEPVFTGTGTSRSSK